LYSAQAEFQAVPPCRLHAELSAKNCPYWRPGITETFWGTDQLNLLDPFGNKIGLCEPKKSDSAE
jgi:hypothetical protein